MTRFRHELQPQQPAATSDGLRRLQAALEAQIVAAGAAGVTTFNTRAGAVTFVLADFLAASGIATLTGQGGKSLVVDAGGSTFQLTAVVPPNADYGDVTVAAGVWTVDNDVITNAKLANIATATFKGRVTAAAGDPEDLTGTQATTLLDVFTTVLKGLAPASGGGTTNFLRADGTWIAPPGGGGGVTDSDKGDITVTGGGTVWTIDPSVVTLAKQADMATASLIYRKTAGSGAPEVNTLATLKTDLLLTGTNSGDQTSIVGITGSLAEFNTALTGADFTTGGGTATGTNTGDQTITLTGNVTGTGTGSFAATIADDAVTLAKMANVATATVFYRKTAATGDPEVQTLATLKTDLSLTGTNSGDQTSIVGITGSLAEFNTALTGADFVSGGGTATGTNTGDQTITLTGDVTGTGTGSFVATIGNDKVTNAMLANMATATFKARVTAATGDPEDLTGAQATTLLDAFTSALKGLAPASGGGTANFLRADGVWVAPPGAAGGYSVVTKTASYTETTTSGELLIKADLAAGFTITLPTAVGNTAKLHIKKIQGAGLIAIDGASTETIDGGPTATLTDQYEAITLVSDNVNWMII